jgi:hypothetical protein
MRNYLDILKEIASILIANGFVKEKQQLDNEIAAASTGTELCLRAGSVLLTFENTVVKNGLENFIAEYIDYCKLNGLFLKTIHDQLYETLFSRIEKRNCFTREVRDILVEYRNAGGKQKLAREIVEGIKKTKPNFEDAADDVLDLITGFSKIDFYIWD